ncbi:hypothetical protein [Gordonia caeni]|uniref:Tape measure protein n=1 Tax=Gordonia caeni TaxID=1007097 RepID=A0ABP7PE90_9ACTN
MALVVGRLLAQLGIDDAGFSSGMNAAQQQYQRTGQSAAQMARTVEQSAAKVQSARASEQSAALRVQAAEKSLNALRKSGETDALKLAQAESKLQTALASQNQAKIRAANAARGLSAAQRQQASASQQVSSANQKATTSTNNLAASATRAKSALASIGVGLSLTAVVAGMTQAVGAARALGAQTNQLSVIFGDNAGQIKSWGSTAVDSMRMSQREAQGAAIQFATFGKAMGLSGQELVKFSTQQTKLAADLASFQGIPVADAVEAMGSAFAGETETMRKYGVLLDENTIKQAAYKNGIAEVGTQLTAQQKAQGAYFEMQEQLAHVNGDVERSNGKFGASLKTLTARLEETQAAVGDKLIPVVQPFVDLLAGPGLSAVQGFAGAIGAAGSAFGSLPGPVQAALAAVVAFRIAQRVAGDQMTAMGARIAGVVTSFRTLGAAATVQTSMGTVAMGRFGTSIARLGTHVPVIARMQQSFVNAAVSADRFPRSAGAMAAGMTGIRSAAGGLMGMLGGPWGIAIMGATALLGMFIQKKQEDAQKSAEAKAKTEEWAQALVASGGAINDNIRQMAAHELQQKSFLEMAQAAGLGMDRLTEAILGTKEQYESARATMDDYLRTQLEVNQGNFASDFAHQTMMNGLDGVRNSYTDGQRAAANMGKATGDNKVAFDSATQSTTSMSKAMEDYKEETGGAAAQVDKLAKALKGLADDKLTLEEADQSWHDNMRDLNKTLGETTDALITQSGAIDVTSEAGSKLQDAVVDQRDAYFDVAAAAKRYTDEQQALGKMDAGQALDHINGKLGPLRQSFIDAAMAAGKSADEAKRMADHYLGLPGQITTQLELKGVDAAISKLDSLKVKGAQPVKGTYNMVDNTPEVRRRLDDIKVRYSIVDGKIVINQDDIQRADNALRDLGFQTEALPEGYIKITDTSDENINRLKSLGIEVQTLPNGTIVINPDDAAFWTAVQRAQQPGEKKIWISYETRGEQQAYVDRIAQFAENANGSIRQRADGALDSPQIQSGSGMGRYATTPFGPVQWAEGETDWEAFIPGALSKRGRATAILKETARRFGYGLAPLADLARGDYTPAMREIWGLEEDSPIVDAILSARRRVMAEGGITAGGLKNYMRGIDGASYVWGGWGQGFNTDCSGGQSIAVNATNGNSSAGTGQRSATGGYSSWLPAQGYQLGRAPAGVPAHEVGWSSEHASGTIFDPQGGDVNIEMGGGNGGGAYGRGAVSSRDGQFPNQAWKALQGDAGTGVTGVAPAATERERNIDAVVAEGKRRGKSDKEIKSAVMTVLAETNGENLGHGMDGDNAGLFQQRDSWGTREERMNPTTAAGKYFDAMDKVDGRDSMSEAELAQAIQRSSDSSGDIYAAKSAEADQMMAASMARLSGGTTTNNITMGGTGGVGGGNVFVTGGHLDYIGGSRGSADTTPTTPAAPDKPDTADSTTGDGSLRLTSPLMRGQDPLRFQEGGTIPGTGTGDKIPLLGEPGEFIVRRDVARRPGMRDFLKKLNTGFYGEVPRYQDGGTVGFGGYADDTRDHMKPKSWRDALHLGVGAGFTGASLVAPYVAMAQSGQIDLGNLAPTIDTGSNSIDGVSQFVGDYAGQISNQLGAILAAIQKGERITVVVESDKSPSAAAMGATAAGL